MGNRNNNTAISKFFSYVLRHKPEAANLTLDSEGWCDVDALIAGARDNGYKIALGDVERVVANNEKKRFTLSEDGTRIRAAQGHSNKTVAIQYEPVTPPDVLYHGTATRFLESILAEGLKPGNRQHVHLSADEETAIKVGQRHGKPVVLKIDAVQMHDAGLIFHQADNGVWLIDEVPPDFIID
ncbi:MAG: RNA 2'-phosphotransferase [Pseudomonadota bacterium]